MQSTMNMPTAPLLLLQPHATVLIQDQQVLAELTVGLRDIAEPLFLHEPPLAVELERAIDVVEDALSASGLRHAARGLLLVQDPALCALLRLNEAHEPLPRDAVEALFERLALASSGRRDAMTDLRLGRHGAAALLLLRECMHHLGFTQVAAPVRPQSAGA